MYRTAPHKLDWHTPLEDLALTGQTPGISGMLHFVFWEQFLKDHEEKPFQQYLKEDHDEKPHQLWYLSPLDKGCHLELKIIGYTEEFEGQLEVKVGDDKFEDLGMYDEMCPSSWQFRKIIGHRTFIFGKIRLDVITATTNSYVTIVCFVSGRIELTSH